MLVSAATPCPADDAIAALVQRELTDDESAELTAHIDDCVTCQRVMLAAVRAGVAPLDTLASAPGPASDASEPGAQVGMRIGRYELRALLGVGGMGAVYDAHDSELDRAVALKVLRSERSGAPEFAERLVHESRLMARVVHPSVIAVYDAGRAGDAVFIAMELIRGSTLTAWLAAHPLDWRATVGLFVQAGQGLAAAHRAGIVHRDFKPDNVLVSGDGSRVVVTDFGIARHAPLVSGQSLPRVSMNSLTSLTSLNSGMRMRSSGLTTEGAVLGTPAYMAPEQIAAQPVDRAADIFAFSASLWEALFRKRPFPGASIAEIYTAMHRPLGRPPAGAMRVPRRLIRALATGLAVDPRARWRNMPALLDELSAILSTRRRVALAAGAAGLVGVGLAAALIVARSAPVDRCAAGLAAFNDVYNPEIESGIRAALAGDPAVRDQVVTNLASHALAWRTTQVSTCHADRDVIQDARTAACLDARRIELAAVADDIISDGSAGAPYAAKLGDIGSSPARCTSPPPGLLFIDVPTERSLRRQVTAQREQLWQAVRDANKHTGEPQRAVDQMTAMVPAAAIWPPLQAEVRYALGIRQRAAGDVKAAIATLLEAARLAESVHADEIAYYSWEQLVEASALDNRDPARALEYATHGDAALERIGRPDECALRLYYSRGLALVDLQSYDDAKRSLDSALAISEREGPVAIAYIRDAFGVLDTRQGRYADAVSELRAAVDQRAHAPGSPPDRTQTHALLATDLALLGQPAEAEREADRAVELADAALAEGNHDRPAAHLSRARVLREVGRDDDALREASATRAMIERTRGAHSASYGDALELHGSLLVHAGRSADGEPMIARACDIIAFVRGDDSADVAVCASSRAVALNGLHRYAAALAALDRAIPVLVKTYGTSQLPVAEAITARGHAHAALGHTREAADDFERAIAILAAMPIEPGYLAAARIGLGRALWATQPQKARAALTEGLVQFASANPRWSHQRDDAAAWLAARDHTPHRR